MRDDTDTGIPAVSATAMLASDPDPDPDRTRAEVALADMKGKGISWALFGHVLRYAEAENMDTVEQSSAQIMRPHFG
jgi:hypothetical protein